MGRWSDNLIHMTAGFGMATALWSLDQPSAWLTLISGVAYFVVMTVRLLRPDVSVRPQDRVESK